MRRWTIIDFWVERYPKSIILLFDRSWIATTWKDTRGVIRDAVGGEDTVAILLLKIDAVFQGKRGVDRRSLGLAPDWIEVQFLDHHIELCLLFCG
jgi:hypothetical protein